MAGMGAFGMPQYKVMVHPSRKPLHPGVAKKRRLDRYRLRSQEVRTVERLCNIGQSSCAQISAEDYLVRPVGNRVNLVVPSCVMIGNVITTADMLRGVLYALLYLVGKMSIVEATCKVSCWSRSIRRVPSSSRKVLPV